MRNRQLDFTLMVFIAVLFSASTNAASAHPFQDPAKTVSDTANDSAKKLSSDKETQSKSDDSAEVSTADDPSDAKAASVDEDAAPATTWNSTIYPLLVLTIGITVVLGLIIGFKINAFLALITSAIVVSILAPGEFGEKIGRVASALGDAVGGIGIVIALAAIIGKCMLDSGAADRIVRAFMDLLGEKRAPVALLGSGFVLAVPVFFDTVFYLLVPLARSLHKRTGVKYLLYIMAIGAGGAITHTLVPPTPGPLLMASNLGVDLGTMIFVGAIVALPAAFAGLMCGSIADRVMQTPMRELPGSPEPEPIKDEDLPSLWLSLAPVIIPVILISFSTVATTIADKQHASRFRLNDLDKGFASIVSEQYKSSPNNVARLIADHPAMEGSTLLSAEPDYDKIRAGLNELIRDRNFYDEDSFLGIKLNPTAKKLLKKKGVRMKPAIVERMNRTFIESAYPNLVEPHDWKTTPRQVADVFDFFGNANFALLVSALIALITLAKQRDLSFAELAKSTEEALMSGGVIILITAGGGAFGKMLDAANIGDAIQNLFSGDGGFSGIGFLLLGFLISAVLKVAQGSSTVAMIVGSSMVAAIVNGQDIGFNYVYLATSIGAGSLFGSWMNDSGFWIFAKMGGLTEGEALKSWTVMLIVLSLVSLFVTILLSLVLPLA